MSDDEMSVVGVGGSSAGEAPGVPVQERVRKLLATLNAHLYGKEEAVRLALLSAVAGESVFFLGPPGTAKSMISRRISCAFKDIDREREYFEYLMNEFSTPDEICGPVSLKKLNEDQYLRLTEGYLPKAKVAFLDEIWKSGPAILNTLLTIVNEKKFHNGRRVEPVPLVSLSAASNELPERGRGLEALWDRFVLRVLVNPVASEDDFFKVVDSPAQEEPEPESQHQLGFGELEAWQDSIDGVELGDDARKVITAIRRELERRNQKLEEKEREAEGWYVSDRRWKKIVRILKASAFLNGRDTVDLMDCSLIAYCIWNTGPQQQQVDAILEEILAEYGMDCSTIIGDLRDQLEEFTEAVDKCWFKETLKDRIVTVDGNKCYECIKSDDNSTWYVGVDGNHPVYDAQMQCQWNGQNYRYSRNGDVISCRYNFTVQKDSEFITPKSFEPAVKSANLKLFTEKEFNPLLQKIEGEIKSLQDFKAENEAPFEENAFANQQYRPILMKKIDDSITELEDLKLELHKQQNRYEGKASVPAIGDTGPGGGLVFHCDGTMAYEVSGVLGNDYNWVYAMQKAAAYRGGGFSDWQLPTKDELDLVYQNLRKPGIIDGDDWHWAWTQGYNAWAQCFGDGQGRHYGFNGCAVRAIRAFPIQPFNHSTTYKGTGQAANGAGPAIGDTGPGGGLVFHCDGTMAYEVSGVLGRLDWEDARRKAMGYRGGGFSDWRLPTEDELDLVYQNLRKPGIIDGDDWHWSSSQNPIGYLAQCFGNGRQVSGFYDRLHDIYRECAVRVIRAFPIQPFNHSTTYKGTGQAANGAGPAIGDTGPGGGLIFHIDGTRAYEVSGVLGNDYRWADAMQKAMDYRGGGFSDWRLPTKDELDLVYQNLRKPGIIDGDDWHWSSSPQHYDNYWAQRFGNGRQDYYYDIDGSAVRAIRAFPIQPFSHSTT